MIWTLWHTGIAIRRWVHCGHKGLDMVNNNAPYHYTTRSSLNRWCRMDLCFHVVYAKFCPYHLNVFPLSLSLVTDYALVCFHISFMRLISLCLLSVIKPCISTTPGASCSKVIWLDFGYWIGSNLENGLFKRIKGFWN